MSFLSIDIPADVDERKKDKGSISQFLGDVGPFFISLPPSFFPFLLLHVRLIKVPELARHEPCPYVLPFSRIVSFIPLSASFVASFFICSFASSWQVKNGINRKKSEQEKVRAIKEFTAAEEERGPLNG